MEKERGMEEPQATPALQEFPQLQRLAMFSPATQGLIADYLAYLRARHYTPSVQEGTIRALKSFAVLMPAARQSVLYQDLTQTTPTDIDAWSEASFRHQLAPGTVATRLRVVCLPQPRDLAHGTANPQPHDGLSQTGRHHHGLFAAFASA